MFKYNKDDEARGIFMGEESFNADRRTLEYLFTSIGRYEVPANNRDYSWEKKNEVQDFWDDLNAIRNHKRKEHFFGSMFFVKVPDNNRLVYVLDGQQRLATVTILLSVIRDFFSEINDKRESNITGNIIVKGDIETLEEEMRLTLNVRNREFFREYIQNSLGSGKRRQFNDRIGGLKYTNKLIKDAYNFFQEEIRKELVNKDNKQKGIHLARITKILLEKFKVIETVVSDYDEAYLLFEAINFRGLELSISDLFKNLLIGKATTDEQRGIVIDKWDEIADFLEDTKIRYFLRHYWISKIENVTEKELYKEFKIYIEQHNPTAIIKELRDEAEIYNALSTPNSDFWKPNKEIPKLLEEITTLGIKQCFPLLLSGWNRYKNKQSRFEELLNLSINFSFRYITIAGFNNKALEGLYSDIAIELRTGDINNLDEIRNRLRTKYIDDSTFHSLFTTKQIKRNNQIPKYIFRKIEEYLTPNAEKKTIPDITLEHIIPKKPNREWITYLESKQLNKDDLVYKIGNMTLLTHKMNSSAQNSYFTNKRDKYYIKSELKINEDLKDKDEWNEQTIKIRQETLGEYAQKIWKI